MSRVLFCLIALVLAAAPAAAQNDPRLVAAVRAAQEGQSDSARSAVDRLLAATAPSDSLYPEILYTHAMVSNTAADMRTFFQRVVVEYPTSTWADDALIRVVQLDYATRSYENAARNLERLRLDFPATPLFAQAAYWGGRTYLDLKDTTRACRWLADGIARADADLELQRQLGFLYQRCPARAPPPRRPTPAEPPSPPAPTPRPSRARRAIRPSRRRPPPRTPPPRGWPTHCPSVRPLPRSSSGFRSPPSLPRPPRTMRRTKRSGSAFRR